MKAHCTVHLLPPLLWTNENAVTGWLLDKWRVTCSMQEYTWQYIYHVLNSFHLLSTCCIPDPVLSTSCIISLSPLLPSLLLPFLTWSLEKLTHQARSQMVKWLSWTYNVGQLDPKPGLLPLLHALSSTTGRMFWRQEYKGICSSISSQSIFIVCRYSFMYLTNNYEGTVLGAESSDNKGRHHVCSHRRYTVTCMNMPNSEQ